MDTLSKLEQRLTHDQTWPGRYVFKFVVPAAQKSALLALLPLGLMSERPSKNQRFIAITLRTVMPDPKAVLSVYQNAAVIEGLIAL